MSDTEGHWNWEVAIVEACGPPPDNWMANKFIAKLREHKRKHPAFKVERVAALFIDAPPKVRAAYRSKPAGAPLSIAPGCKSSPRS